MSRFRISFRVSPSGPAPRRIRSTLYCARLTPPALSNSSSGSRKAASVRAILKVASCSRLLNGFRWWSSARRVVVMACILDVITPDVKTPVGAPGRRYVASQTKRMEGPMGGFDGKVAIVTGGGSGLGEAIGKALAGRGVKVILSDIRLEAAERVA